MNIKRVRKAQEGEYDPADFPVSENSTDDMYGQLLAMIKTVKNRYLSALNKLFVEDKEFLKSFQEHSAAKTVHHGFIGDSFCRRMFLKDFKTFYLLQKVYSVKC